MSEEVFTTGQVAKMCRVAPRTVAKWCDSGKLPGYRLPGSQDRRFERRAVVRFMMANGLPVPAEMPASQPAEAAPSAISAYVVVAIGMSNFSAGRLAEFLPDADGFRVLIAQDAFDAGFLACNHSPRVAVIDLAIGRSEGLRMADRLNDMGTVGIGLANEDETNAKQLGDVFDLVYAKPISIALIANGIRELKGGA